MAWVDFAELKAKLDFEQVLQFLGIENLKPKGGKRYLLQGPCPVHQATTSRSFLVNTQKKVWRCFSPKCGFGGNSIDLVARLRKLSFRDAAELLHEHFIGNPEFESDVALDAVDSDPELPALRVPQPEESKPAPTHRNNGVPKPAKANARPKDEEEEATENEALKLVLDLDPSHPALREHGYQSETLAHFGVGYCATGIMRGRIAFPVHDEEGVLVAYIGRAAKAGVNRWLFPRNFHRHLELYNVHRVKASASEGRVERIVLVESPWAVLSLYEAGVPECCALLGLSVSPRQIALLKSVTDRIELFLDRDDEAREMMLPLIDTLARHLSLRAVTYPDAEGNKPHQLSQDWLRERFQAPGE